MISKSQQKSINKQNTFQDAYNAVLHLVQLKSSLSKKEEETLSLLIDQKLMSELNQSLKEAKEGKLEPLSNII